MSQCETSEKQESGRTRDLRIARSGRRFVIEDGVIWNLVDRDGILHGQAAAFRTWRDV